MEASGRSGGAPAGTDAARIGKTTRRNRIWAVSLAVLLALMLAGGIGYHRRSQERSYLANYVLAVYGIKSGFDRGCAVSNAYVTNWRRNESMGTSPPETDSMELADLDTVEAEVGRIMAQLGNPPGKLRNAGARLATLYSVYQRQNSLAHVPHGTPDGYEQALRATLADFMQKLDELKRDLPPSLREEAKKAGTKYNLRFLGY
jgi:hypothetical protein